MRSAELRSRDLCLVPDEATPLCTRPARPDIAVARPFSYVRRVPGRALSACVFAFAAT